MANKLCFIGSQTKTHIAVCRSQEQSYSGPDIPTNKQMSLYLNASNQPNYVYSFYPTQYYCLEIE